MRASGKPAMRNPSRAAAVILSAVLCAVLSAALTADELATGSRAEQLLSRRGSLTLRDTTLSEALFTISETWGVNLLFGKDISGHVNGVFRDVTLREVLDSLLLANGYGYRPKGQSLIIMSIDALGDTNAMLQTASIPLPSGRGEDVVEAARMLLSPQGKIHAMTSIGAIMVSDYPENIARVRSFADSVGRPQTNAAGGEANSPPAHGLTPLLMTAPASSQSRIAYFSPKHTKAESLQETFQSFLGPQAKVVVVPEENRIVIVDDPDGIRLAQQIFSELDRPRGQVRITALIYDVNIEELENLGFNWTHNARLGGPNQLIDGKFGTMPDPTAGAFTIGTATGAAIDAATASSTVGAARLTTLNRYFDLSTVVSALDQVEGARLLADPSVTVIDREEASIRIVTEVPIQQLTQTSEGGSIGTTSFREAGVTLTVTPQIGGDGTITMNVSPTFSVLSGFTEGQPIIDSREASTTVRIANGQTLVIGGLRQRSEIETQTGIPKLMKWKHLGKIFRSHGTTIQESELIVFLRPEITTPDSLGTDRESAGLCVTHKALSQLNWPSELPVVPSCGDPYCPYHHPRPRFVNPGAIGMGTVTPNTTLYEPMPELPVPETPGQGAEKQPHTGGPVNFLPPPVPLLDESSESDDSDEPSTTDFDARWKQFLGPKNAVRSPGSKRITVSPASLSRTVGPEEERPAAKWPEWTRPIRQALHRQQ